ncbi:MAG: sigma 54-interacting transcriptional regulator [Sedimentibacter saalensis]|uniref:sigma-54 interaction domain-containing protein n=1 Tax=Sedimentibacter saalensis TaxID=130788 RepID=UPI0031597568
MIKIKKILVVSEGRNTGIRILNQLNQLLGKYVEVDNMLISEMKSKEADADLILFTSAHFLIRASRYIDSSVPTLVAKRVIDHKNIKEIISIEYDEDVLFINDSYESTKEAIEQLYELGLDHVRYNAYYPGCSSFPQLQTAITPGEGQLAPYKPEKLIDIGSRILDVETIHEITRILDVDKFLKDSLITDYIRDIVEISREIDESRKTSNESMQMLQMIVNTLDYGVAFVNSNGIIMSINSKFEYILGLKKKCILEKNFQDIIRTPINELKDNSTFQAKIENKEVSINVRQVNFSKRYGFVISVKINKSSNETDIKTSFTASSYVKRNLHNFDDYLTINNNVFNMINRAKKFSKSDGTVLITGENGTGKEILAQAIHMNSYRSSKSFVPINIATLTSNLVEAELFGYEEGTFTGAVKGGKMGIFEIADGGTIFIDEIGDVPVDVQAKLLRVLEEKRIRKIGSADELSVDVRIISATNKNLLDLIKENKFRLDLFYRLNILPLETIPLRKRKEDVEFLLKYFININLDDKKIKSLNEFFAQETIEFLNKYQWPGNVRELINLIEYLMLIYEGEKISLNHLHSYMHNVNGERRIFLDEYEDWVLRKFSENKNMPVGRAKIAEIAIEEGMDIKEGKIRRIISDLKNMGLINDDGSKGSKITELGEKTLAEIYK